MTAAEASGVEACGAGSEGQQEGRLVEVPMEVEEPGGGSVACLRGKRSLVLPQDLRAVRQRVLRARKRRREEGGEALMRNSRLNLGL